MNKYTKYQHIKNKFKRLKVCVFFVRAFSPMYSYCHHCGLTWNVCEHKSVDLDEFRGVFATCQYCWDTLPLKELERCYNELYSQQKSSSIQCNYNMDYNLTDLMNALRKQYIESRGKNGIRKEKLQTLLDNVQDR